MNLEAAYKSTASTSLDLTPYIDPPLQAVVRLIIFNLISGIKKTRSETRTPYRGWVGKSGKADGPTDGKTNGQTDQNGTTE